MNSLENKIIVVTGGSGLIGTSIIQNLSAKGAIAINADINVIDNLAEGVIKCDVSDKKSIERILQNVIACYGRIDGWVNNAYPRTSDWGNTFENIDFASWNRNFELQLASIFFMFSIDFENNERAKIWIHRKYGINLRSGRT